MSSEREVMTWDDLGAGARELAERIHADAYEPDVILAIARGGLLLAGALGYALGVKNTYTMNVEFYTGPDGRLPAPIVLPPVPALVDLTEARLLIADDVADTGRTLALVKDFCDVKVAEARTAVLYEKPHSVVACDYVWRTTEAWITFPWSAEPPVTESEPAPEQQPRGGELRSGR